MSTKTYQETPCPTRSPWGHIQTASKCGAGLWMVHTASHGGFWLSPERVADFRVAFPTFDPFAGLPWLEEDCDVNLAVVLWPEEFADLAVHTAVEAVTRGALYFEGPRAWLLSDAGAAVRARSETFGEEVKNKWRRLDGESCVDGWITRWRRGFEVRSIKSRGLPTVAWATDRDLEQIGRPA